MPRDSTTRILAVAFAVCLVCSMLVSAAAVTLKKRQDENRLIDKRRNILRVANRYDPARPVEEQFRQIQTRVVDLGKGGFTTGDDPSAFDSRSYVIPSGRDSAGIRTRPRYVEVYLVAEQRLLQQIVLPVYGKGLWSTMYGFIALGPDLSTVTGFGFYEHGETPGLGGEVDNPVWLAKWPGKLVYDSAGIVRIEVIKGEVVSGSPDARHKIDGLSGATLTARGVSNLLNYWLGENGYQSFLQNIRSSGGFVP